MWPSYITAQTNDYLFPFLKKKKKECHAYPNNTDT